MTILQIDWESNGIEVVIDVGIFKWTFAVQHLELPL